MTALRLSLCLLLLLAPATTRADLPVRKVTVIGTTIIKVVPDEMRWTVQVSIMDSTLAKAKVRHDGSLADALKFIKSFGGTVKDLQTGGIRIDRNTFAPENSLAAQKPYTCSTQFTFTLTDFEKYGPICDGLAKLDGVEVPSVEYASSREADVRRDALKQALLNGHDKASDLATTAGCYIDKPLDILEGTPDIGPRPMTIMARANSSYGGGTPDAVAGQIEISATVTVTYDLYYR